MGHKFSTLTTEDWKRGVESARSKSNLAWAKIQEKLAESKKAPVPAKKIVYKPFDAPGMY